MKSIMKALKTGILAMLWVAAIIGVVGVTLILLRAPVLLGIILVSVSAMALLKLIAACSSVVAFIAGVSFSKWKEKKVANDPVVIQPAQ